MFKNVEGPVVAAAPRDTRDLAVAAAAAVGIGFLLLVFKIHLNKIQSLLPHRDSNHGDFLCCSEVLYKKLNVSGLCSP